MERYSIDGARRAIVADLRDGFHQVGVDKWIVRRITNDAHGILTLLHLFHSRNITSRSRMTPRSELVSRLGVRSAIGPWVSHAI